MRVGSLPAITRAMRAARQGLQSVLPVRAGLEPLSRGLSSYTMRQHSALSQLCEDPVCSRTLSISRSFKYLLDKGWFVVRLRTDFSALLRQYRSRHFPYLQPEGFLIRLLASDFSLVALFV